MKWSRENYYHNLSSPYCLRLASGDASGKIIVWDVVSGTAHCEIQEHSKPIQGKESLRNPPPLFVGLNRFFVLQCCTGREHYPGNPGNPAKKKIYAASVVSYLFSLRCSYHHSLSFLLTHTTPPSSSFLHSPLCLPLFLFQTWSGCGTRMCLVICCWPSTLPTTLFCGTEIQAPSCGRRATLRTSSPFLLTPLTPPTWHVGGQHSWFNLSSLTLTFSHTYILYAVFSIQSNSIWCLDIS